MRIKIILEPSAEGGYTAIVPSLPGCISERGILKKRRSRMFGRQSNCI